MYKIILAIAGFFLFKGKLYGALLGFVIGLLIDNYQKVMSGAKAQASREGRAFSPEDIFSYYQQRSTTNDIPTMLMVLSAAVMKADGKVLKSELDFVKSFFNHQFGPQFSRHHLQVLKKFLDSPNIPLDQICNDIRLRTPVEVRIQLLHYLFGIAKADNDVSESEIRVIQHISRLLGIPSGDFESVKNMFYRNIDSDYTILGVDPNASDEEVKKAYRKMAIRFHPDKVSQMGEEYQKGAKEKFQRIQDAYEAIKKRRGFK